MGSSWKFQPASHFLLGIWWNMDTPWYPPVPNCSLHSPPASHSSIGRGAGPLWLKHSGKAFRAWQLSGDVHWDFHPAKLAETCHKTAKPSRNKAIVRLLYVSAHIVVETGKSRILWASRFAYSIAVRCFLASKTSCENKTNYDKLKLGILHTSLTFQQPSWKIPRTHQV